MRRGKGRDEFDRQTEETSNTGKAGVKTWLCMQPQQVESLVLDHGVDVLPASDRDEEMDVWLAEVVVVMFVALSKFGSQ